MMIAARLSKQAKQRLWAEAVRTAGKLNNLTVNSTTEKTPQELWDGKKPDLYPNMIEFGRICYVSIRQKIKAKFQDKSFKGIMIGYAENHTQDVYRVYNIQTKQIILTRDIKWDDWERSQTNEDIDILTHPP